MMSKMNIEILNFFIGLVTGQESTGMGIKLRKILAQALTHAINE